MNSDERWNEVTRRLATLEERVVRIEERLAPSAPPWARSTTQPARPAARPSAPPWRARTGRAIELNPSRLLAGAGGLVLLAGLGFLLRYAVARGWLGPEVRVVLALAGSAALAGLGARLERAVPTRVVGQICTATGAAGAYIAVVAASVGYDLIPATVGLTGAGAVAAAAIARGAWSRVQAITVLGVGGALVAPVLLDVPPAGATLAFVVLALAAGLAVAAFREWPAVTAVAFGLVAPQLWSLVGSVPVAALLTATAMSGGLVLATCVSHARGRQGRSIAAPAVVMALNAASTAGLGWLALADWLNLETVAAGAWVATVAAVHLATGTVVSRRWFAAPVGVVAIVAGALLADLAVVILTDGYAAGALLTSVLAVHIAGGAAWSWLRPAARVTAAVLTTVAALHAVSVVVPMAPAGSFEAVVVVTTLAAAAVVLALVARPVARDTAIVAGAGLAGVALVRVLTVEAPLRSLLEGPSHLVAAVGMCAAVVLAGLLLGWWVDRRFTLAAVAVANYAVSFAAVAMDPEGAGRVALTGLWAVAGGLALVAGRRLSRPDVRRGGAALLAAAVAKAALVDTVMLDGTHRAAALLLCGASLVATAVAEARRSDSPAGDGEEGAGDPVATP